MNLNMRSAPIDDYTNYTVTEDGRVFNERSKELKQDTTHDGYYRVTLYRDKKPKHFPVHRLVANAFNENPEGKPTVNHIDGDKSNNHASNLEWSTHSENSQHAYDNGLNRCHFTAEDRRRAGITKAAQSSKPVMIIETGEVYSSASECARAKGLDRGNIVSCCNSHRNKHRGLHFEWI